LLLKKNRRGITQERVLILSNRWLYNVQMNHNPVTIHSLKWAFPIRAIKAIACVKTNQLTMYIDQEAAEASGNEDVTHRGEKGDNLNDTMVFYFRETEQRATFVAVLAVVYFYNTSQSLIMENKDSLLARHRDFDKARAILSKLESKHMLKWNDQDKLKYQRAMKTIARLKKALPTLEGEEKGKKDGEIKIVKGPLIGEYLEKYTKDGRSKHQKYFALFPTGEVKWGDSPNNFKYSESLTMVSTKTPKDRRISRSEELCFFFFTDNWEASLFIGFIYSFT